MLSPLVPKLCKGGSIAFGAQDSLSIQPGRVVDGQGDHHGLGGGAQAVLGIDGLQDGVALSVGGYDGQHFLLLLQGDARELPHFFRIGCNGPG